MNSIKIAGFIAQGMDLLHDSYGYKDVERAKEQIKFTLNNLVDPELQEFLALTPAVDVQGVPHGTIAVGKYLDLLIFIRTGAIADTFELDIYLPTEESLLANGISYKLRPDQLQRHLLLEMAKHYKTIRLEDMFNGNS